ncbi:hypothetical protein GWK47_054895 [Chionoecetes opilio]|uniref:Uncharacterized protein n=1 Tax=Chionoecetes opilio TaxID=41210 RepID=A0A8J4Y9B3_CHIOP|nr:hypothetical protein GWK47_054895 [Chionoecetes opilio]
MLDVVVPASGIERSGVRTNAPPVSRGAANATGHQTYASRKCEGSMAALHDKKKRQIAPVLARWEKRVLTQLPNASSPPMGGVPTHGLSVLAPRLLPIRPGEAPAVIGVPVCCLVGMGSWWARVSYSMALMFGVCGRSSFASVPSSEHVPDVHSSWLNMVARPYRPGTARRPSMAQGRAILEGKVCRGRETSEEVDEEQCEQEPAEQMENSNNNDINMI